MGQTNEMNHSSALSSAHPGKDTPVAARHSHPSGKPMKAKNQGAQIVRVRPVQAVEARLGGQENRARHPARATRPTAIPRSWILTIRGH
jgi:hypothetical protein